MEHTVADVLELSVVFDVGVKLRGSARDRAVDGEFRRRVRIISECAKR